MRIQRISGVIACAALLSLAACGTDSTGPNNLDANSALQSLRLGLGGISDIEGPSGATVIGSLGVIAPLLDQINVTIDGKSQTMFGLGLRDSYPAGTCEETVFPNPDFPPPPGQCTPMSLGVVLLLWQSHSAGAPPDRLILNRRRRRHYQFRLRIAYIGPWYRVLSRGNQLLDIDEWNADEPCGVFRINLHCSPSRVRQERDVHTCHVQRAGHHHGRVGSNLRHQRTSNLDDRAADG